MTAKPRLLIVSGSFPNIRCGVSGHTDLIAKLTAQRQDYDVHVLTSDDSLVDTSLAKNYTLHPIIKKWSPKNVLAAILDLNPDIVHIQNPTIKYTRFNAVTMSSVAPKLKKLRPSLPIVVTQHDIAISRPIFRWRYKALFQAADAVLVSNSRDEQAVLALGIPPQKTHRAPVSSHFKSPPPRTMISVNDAREVFKLSPHAPCLATFGYIQPSRNLHILLQALKQLIHQFPHIHLINIGGPFPGCESYFRYCQEIAANLGLISHVTWTGFANEQTIAHGLLAADVFVSLFRRGADLRNTSIITAMLAQLPIITTVNPKYYVDRDLEALDCRLVNPKQPAPVAHAIAQTLQSPPDPDWLQRRAQLFHPDTVWKAHIDAHYRAYNRQLPVPFDLNL